ncbi:MAG: hypothetical protein MN733_23140 [Nitrososphaera sp.]|nr:hypothetical protein [Nitrososphaera sp.]
MEPREWALRLKTKRCKHQTGILYARRCRANRCIKCIEEMIRQVVEEELEEIAVQAERRRPCCDGKPHSDFDFHDFANWIRTRIFYHWRNGDAVS